MLEQKLGFIGLNKKEIIIYLVISKYKKIIPSTISYITKINRTTVYTVIKWLLEKNLIAEETNNSNKEIICLPIENLNNLVEKEQHLIKKKKQVTEEIIQQLKQNQVKDIYIPEVRKISEENIESYLYHNSHKWNKSCLGHDCIWWWFQDSKFPYYYMDWIDYIWKKSPKEIKLQMFGDISEVENNIWDKFERRKILFSEDFNNFDGTMWIIWDYIINIFLEDSPFYMIEMYNPITAKNLRKMFRVMWESQLRNK